MNQSSKTALQNVRFRYVLAVKDQYLASGQTLDVEYISKPALSYFGGVDHRLTAYELFANPC
jgi:hypothetical protein